MLIIYLKLTWSNLASLNHMNNCGLNSLHMRDSITTHKMTENFLLNFCFINEKIYTLPSLTGVKGDLGSTPVGCSSCSQFHSTVYNIRSALATLQACSPEL